MAKRFTNAQWDKIEEELLKAPAKFGMPEGGREESLVFASFNIRKLNTTRNRKRELDFMARFGARCDLLAIQEVQDHLSGLQHLRARMDERVASAGAFGMVVSDITGRVPGKRGLAERLAFIYRRGRVHRADMSSDLTVDRTGVLENFARHEDAITAAWKDYQTALDEFNEGTRKKKPKIKLPAFLTFARTPHVTAFEAPGAQGAKPISFTAVNAHLIFGAQVERDAEFRALLSWMINRLKSEKRMVSSNFILLGDLNLNFDNPKTDRPKIEKFIRNQNAEVFGDANTRRIYFPFIDKRTPTGKVIRSNARETETFDQIAFLHGKDEKRLPNDRWRSTLGSGPDSFDYNVFRFTDLFAKALKNVAFATLSNGDRKDFIAQFEHSVSDHMPIWVRIPRPGFSAPPDA